MRLQRVLAPVVVCALLLTGCGDDGEGTDQGTPTSTTTETTAGTDAIAPDERQSSDPDRAARAEAAVLGLDDFPEGWQEHDPREGLNLETLWQELLGCLGVDTFERPLGIATSPTFLRGIGTQARSTVEYLPPAQVEALAATLGGPELERCATDAFAADVARSAPEGGVPGEVTISPLDFAPLRQATFAWRVNVPIDLQGLVIPIFQDLVVILDGEAVSRLMFLNPGDQFPPELQRTLVETVVDRATRP